MPEILWGSTPSKMKQLGIACTLVDEDLVRVSLYDPPAEWVASTTLYRDDAVRLAYQILNAVIMGLPR